MNRFFRNIVGKLFIRYTNYKLVKSNIPLINPADDKIYMVDEYERHDNYLNKDEIIQIINPRRKKWNE